MWLSLIRGDSNDRRAFFELGKFGSAAVPALAVAIANRGTEISSDAISALGSIGDPAVPVLKALLMSRFYSADSLSKSTEYSRMPQRDFALAGLIENLNHENLVVALFEAQQGLSDLDLWRLIYSGDAPSAPALGVLREQPLYWILSPISCLWLTAIWWLICIWSEAGYNGTRITRIGRAMLSSFALFFLVAWLLVINKIAGVLAGVLAMFWVVLNRSPARRAWIAFDERMFQLIRKFWGPFIRFFSELDAAQEASPVFFAVLALIAWISSLWVLAAAVIGIWLVFLLLVTMLLVSVTAVGQGIILLASSSALAIFLYFMPLSNRYGELFAEHRDLFDWMFAITPDGLLLIGLVVFVWCFVAVVGSVRWQRVRATYRHHFCVLDNHRATVSPSLPWLVRWTGRVLFEEIPPRRHQHFGDYIVCRHCKEHNSLRTAKRLVGLIGKPPKTVRTQALRHVAVYDEASRQATSADIDRLDIYPPPDGVSIDYDHAVNAVLNALHEDPHRTRRLRRVPVLIHTGVELPASTLNLLKSNFGRVRHVG